MPFILASIFPQIQIKKFEASASLRSAMWFILASISSQIQSKISRALPRFARPRGSFWHQSSVKFREKKFREVGLASLGHLVNFFFNPLKCLINDRFGFAMCEKYYSASAAGFFYCGGRDLNMKYVDV